MGLCANCQSLGYISTLDNTPIKDTYFKQIKRNEKCDRCGWKRR